MTLRSKIVNLQRKILGLNSIVEHLQQLESLTQGNLNNSENKWVLKNIKNTKYLLDKKSMVDATIIKQGHWEKESLDLLQRSISKFNKDGSLIFLDIGSYFGLYALQMAETKLFQRIICFESDPFNFVQLKSNLMINDLLEKVETHQVFLSDREEELSVIPSVKLSENRGMASYVINDELEGDKLLAHTLDSRLSIQNESIVVKIDVEDHELQVLKGAQKLIESNRILLLIEHRKLDSTVKKEMLEFGFKLLESVETDHNYLYVKE